MFAEIVTDQYFQDFERDLAEINRIKTRFAPYIIDNPNQKGIRSYDPALARWNFEKFGFRNLEEFKAHEQIQMETFLGECLGVTKKSAKFIIKDGKVYSKDFPNQPFDVVLQRGIEYRRQEGSNDQEREKAELEGWRKIRKKLLDPNTPLGSEILVISGPGIADNTNYPDNYIDLYVSKMDFKSKKRFIERKRFISGLSYEDYVAEFRDYNSSYFSNFNGPIDAWFLKNPLFIDLKNPKKLFTDIFVEPKFETPEEEFEKIITSCMPYIQFYLNILCDLDLKPLEILEAYNTIVYVAQAEKEKLKRKETRKTEKIIYFDFEGTRRQVKYFGYQPIEDKLAGCGLSGGFKLNSNKIINTLFANSVAQFGINTEEDESKYEEVLECVHCPACNSTVRAGIKNGRIHCLSCHASGPYSEPVAA